MPWASNTLAACVTFELDQPSLENRMSACGFTDITNGNIGGQDVEYFRIPASSSSFFALATLTPPSPNPSISSICSLDLDDFPLFFVDSVTQSSAESSPALRQSELLDEPSLECETLSSACSVGTFGPRQLSTLVILPRRDSGDGESVYQTASNEDNEVENSESAPMNNLASLVSAPLGLEPSISQNTIVRKVASPRLNSTLREVLFEGLSKEEACLATCPEPQLLSFRRQETKPTIRPQTGVTQVSIRDRRPGAEKKPAVGTKDICRGNNEVEFVWLHGISIDLLIDQEGFRSATPSFRYSGVSRSQQDLTACTVTFKATSSSKQGFHFHYNPFDGSPVLRRVTIHGEESKDYISKQAQLTMKANGIYTVHGAEISSLSPLHSKMFGQLGYDPDKLDWEFKYLVGDRADSHGRVIDGEKKFVPLTFTCSPWLLHPSQGKRVNLMHIFKKGVSTKLTAEKFEPPSMLTIPEISVNAGDSGSPTSAQDEVGQGGARFHRRARSHAVRDGNGNCEVAAASKNPPELYSQGSAASSRRRASSVGEGSWLSMSM